MNQHNDGIRRRRSIRLRGYDYSQPGAYFITVCTYNRDCIFGDIDDGIMHLNDYGEIVLGCWNDLPNHYLCMELDAFVVMPNHIHGIIILYDIDTSDVGVGFKPTPTGTSNIDNHNVGAGFKPAPTSNLKKRHGLPEIVRAFKTFSSRGINNMHNTQGSKTWQRGYYDHIIREENDLDSIREYIVGNPSGWDKDEYNIRK